MRYKTSQVVSAAHRKLSFAMLLILAGCSLAIASQHSPEDPKERVGLGYLRPGIVSALQADSRMARLDRETKQLKEQPEYLRLSYAPYLVELLTDRRQRETLYYEWAPGTHDLRLVAGRAAWVLQEVYRITIPPLDSKATAEICAGAQKAVQVQLQAIRTTTMALVEFEGVGHDVDALERKYQDKIQAQSPYEGSRRFRRAAAKPLREMLNEFFPLGKKLTDLERIVGQRAYVYDPSLRVRETSEKVTGVFEYGCTDGMFGEAYFFLVRGGVIEAVSWISF